MKLLMSTAIQVPSTPKRNQLIPITVPIKCILRYQGVVFDALDNTVFAKMSKASSVMPVLHAHRETDEKVNEIQQIFFVIQFSWGTMKRALNDVDMPKRISDAARFRNIILVALFSRVHLFMQWITATFNTKMITATTARIIMLTVRLESNEGTS